ncbi:hypothetical protein H9P43_004547 [Blastocladiella emersonii ATCC 22665]|nr:hypothetical protein H9P43_004547 [Blastocladiella emersonii ATCC 22665]
MQQRTNMISSDRRIAFLPTITTQPDWDLVVAEVAQKRHKESFWVSLYSTDAAVESLHGSVAVTRKYESVPVAADGGPEFTVRLLTSSAAARTADNVSAYQRGCVRAAVGLRNPHPWPAMAWMLHAPAVAVAVIRPDQLDAVPDERTLRSKPTPVHSVAFSPAGDLIAYGAANGLVRVVDAADGKMRRTLAGHLGDVLRTRFFPSGQVLLTVSNDLTARIWSVLDGSCPRILKGHTRALTDCGMLDRGKSVVTAARDGTIRVWLCATAECTTVIEVDEDPINEMALLEMAKYRPDEFPAWHTYKSDEEKYMAIAACESGRVTGVHLSTKAEQFTVTYPHRANSLAVLSPDLLAVGYEDGSVIVWDMPLRAQRHHILVFKTPVTQVRRVSDSAVAVASADGLLQVVSWTPAPDGKGSEYAIPHVLTGSDMEPVYALDVAGDAATVVAAGRDGTLRVYRCGADGALAEPATKTKTITTMLTAATRRLTTTTTALAATRAFAAATTAVPVSSAKWYGTISATMAARAGGTPGQPIDELIKQDHHEIFSLWSQFKQTLPSSDTTARGVRAGSSEASTLSYGGNAEPAITTGATESSSGPMQGDMDADSGMLAHRARIANSLLRAIAVHSVAEELTVYREIGEVRGADVMQQLLADQQQVKEECYELDRMAVTDPDYVPRLRKIIKELEVHTAAEEQHELPELRARLNDARLVEIGDMFQAVKNKVPTHAHPAAPTKSGTLEAVVGMLVTPMDKLRDMGREFAEGVGAKGKQ